jgi:hypothetical protein
MFKISQHFGENVASIFKDEEKAMHKTRMKRQQAITGFLLGLLFNPEDWGRSVPPKRLWTFNGLHGVIFPKI